MWTFGKKIAIGFAVSFVLLLGIGTVAYRSIDSITRTSYLVAHTYVVLDHVVELISQLADAETEVRGFVISGDEAYLESYQTTPALGAKGLKDLRELTADNANQQKRISAAEPIVSAKLAALKKTVDLRRQAGPEAAIKSAHGGEGKPDRNDP